MSEQTTPAVKRIESHLRSKGIDPYIAGKARYQLHQLGLNPDDSGELAEWAQAAFDARAEGTGVIITRMGRVVAHTRLVRGRVSGWYVTTEDARRLGIGHEALDMALAGIKRATGEDCGMVTYGEVCQGRRAPEVTA